MTILIKRKIIIAVTFMFAFALKESESQGLYKIFYVNIKVPPRRKF